MTHIILYHGTNRIIIIKRKKKKKNYTHISLFNIYLKNFWIFNLTFVTSQFSRSPGLHVTFCSPTVRCDIIYGRRLIILIIYLNSRNWDSLPVSGFPEFNLFLFFKDLDPEILSISNEPFNFLYLLLFSKKSIATFLTR